MNPDSLREYCKIITGPNAKGVRKHILAHADQWKADNYAHAVEVAAKDVLIADLRDALRWMVNVANDVGKSGGKPYTDEWKDATDAGMAALAGQKE